MRLREQLQYAAVGVQMLSTQCVRPVQHSSLHGEHAACLEQQGDCSGALGFNQLWALCMPLCAQLVGLACAVVSGACGIACCLSCTAAPARQ